MQDWWTTFRWPKFSMIIYTDARKPWSILFISTYCNMKRLLRTCICHAYFASYPKVLVVRRCYCASSANEQLKKPVHVSLFINLSLSNWLTRNRTIAAHRQRFSFTCCTWMSYIDVWRIDVYNLFCVCYNYLQPTAVLCFAGRTLKRQCRGCAPSYIVHAACLVR